MFSTILFCHNKKICANTGFKKKEKRKVGVYSMPIPHTNPDVHGQTE